MTTLPCTIISWLTVFIVGCIAVGFAIWTGWKLFESTRTCKGVWDALIIRGKLEASLRDYRSAQRRMRDKYAEGDEAVKRDLWRNLHACEDRATELLDGPEEKS